MELTAKLYTDVKSLYKKIFVGFGGPLNMLAVRAIKFGWEECGLRMLRETCEKVRW